MSGFLAAALGYREFWSGDQIRAMVLRRQQGAAMRQETGPCQADPSPADAGSLRLMLVFAAGMQRAWLAVDAARVWCVLDDARKADPVIQWVAPRSEAQPVGATRDHTPGSGLLHLGTQGRDWLYSRDLFQDRDIVDAVRALFDAAVRR